MRISLISLEDLLLVSLWCFTIWIIQILICFFISSSSYSDNTDPGQVNVGLAALAQSRPTAGQPQVNQSFYIIQYIFLIYQPCFFSIVWNASILLSASMYYHWLSSCWCPFYYIQVLGSDFKIKLNHHFVQTTVLICYYYFIQIFVC